MRDVREKWQRELELSGPPSLGLLTQGPATLGTGVLAGSALASVPDDLPFRTQRRIAPDEMNRLLEHKLQLGDVLAHVGYGTCAVSFVLE